MSNYTCFLPWQHLILVFASFAELKPQIPTFMNVSSHVAQGSFRYTIPFKPLYSDFKQDVTAGCDYKNTNSNFISAAGGGIGFSFTGAPPVNQTQNISMLYGSYDFEGLFGNHKLNFSLEGYLSPVQFFPNQSNYDFNILRTNSKPIFFYTFLTFGEVYTLPKIMTIALLLRGQGASGTLPSTELFSIGGYDTVRGYREQTLVADNGFIGNLELRAPSFSLIPRWKDSLTFLGFLDYGVGNEFYNPPDQPAPPTQHLLGAGAGFRYRIDPYLAIRCDYGVKLHAYIFSTSPQRLLYQESLGQVHFGALVSY
jgi:hypothetical protein